VQGSDALGGLCSHGSGGAKTRWAVLAAGGLGTDEWAGRESVQWCCCACCSARMSAQGMTRAVHAQQQTAATNRYGAAEPLNCVHGCAVCEHACMNIGKRYRGGELGAVCIMKSNFWNRENYAAAQKCSCGAQ